MSISRQYSLPNVSLLLEGWSDRETPDPESELAIVTGVECRFLPQQQVLRGGKELLDALAEGVGAYVQDILSDLHAYTQQADEIAPGQLRLQPAERSGFHRLIWQPPAAEGQAAAAAAPGKVEFELTTVQLFDLIEAIDQFLLDGTTISQMTFGVAPRPKGARRADRPLAQRTAPAAIGIAGFAAAAAVMLMVPVPEVREVESNEGTATERQDGDASASGSLPVGIARDLAEVPRIDEQIQLTTLANQLQRRLDAAWQDRGLVREPTSYRLWATQSGEVVGFETVAGDLPAAAAPVLPSLLALQEEDPRLLPRVAELRATFNGSGTVTVTPWTDGDTGAE